MTKIKILLSSISRTSIAKNASVDLQEIYRDLLEGRRRREKKEEEKRMKEKRSSGEINIFFLKFETLTK